MKSFAKGGMQKNWKKARFTLLLALCFLFIMNIVQAVTEHGSEAADAGHHASITFLWIAIIIVAAKLSSLVEKWGQPAVLGELLVGVALGNLSILGIHWLEPIKTDLIITFLAELGVVILLFQIGLETHLAELKQVGLRAALVAVLGVVLPFVFGTYWFGPWLIQGLSPNGYMFLGATLTATSVGITARVFKDLGKLNIKEAQIVLGAAVIDDVLGLVILAVVSAIVTLGAASVGMVSWILAKAIIFLVGALVLGQLLAPYLSRGMAKIHAGVGMKFSLAICFALIFAYLAGVIGLAPIIGAFAAGIILKPVHFRYFKDVKIVEDIKQHMEKHHNGKTEKNFMALLRRHSDRHIEDLIEPIALFLVPIFFVFTGFAVDLRTLADPRLVMAGLAITLVAIIAKLLAGVCAGSCNKWLVGWGMVPRGEVGLIFASIGKSLGVIPPPVFSIIIIMVILTTLIPPPILNFILKGMDKKKEKKEKPKEETKKE